jgi:hypothetical protein
MTVKTTPQTRKRRPSKDDHITMSLEVSDPFRAGLRCFVADRTSMLCRHCGESFPMPYGSIPWVVAVTNAFRKEHWYCKAKGGADESRA